MHEIKHPRPPHGLDMTLNLVGRTNPRGRSDRRRPSTATPLHAGHHRLGYLKPLLTGSEPVEIFNYTSSHEKFAQESTADQFFRESQFES